MANDLPEPGQVPLAEPTLGEIMRRAGGRLSHTFALWICGLSVAALAIVLAFGTSSWRIALFLVATLSFGTWTLADHERREGANRAPPWRVLQAVSALVGMASVFLLLLSLLASALGLWIS